MGAVERTASLSTRKYRSRLSSNTPERVSDLIGRTRIADNCRVIWASDEDWYMAATSYRKYRGYPKNKPIHYFDDWEALQWLVSLL